MTKDKTAASVVQKTVEEEAAKVFLLFFFLKLYPLSRLDWLSLHMSPGLCCNHRFVLCR